VSTTFTSSIIHLTSVALVGVGLYVFRESNVIIRNVKISKVLFAAGDAIGIQASSNVWVDHVDLSSDRDHDKVRSSPSLSPASDAHSVHP